ncbi:MAG: 30S ribosomal protein S12 methylthiotransferase RimO [Polyangiaceae bacterium]
MAGHDKTVHFVSLGCPKNRVDSEVMLGVAERAGYRHVAEPEAAEVIVVNTCGFIDAAKQESIETILQLAELKHRGVCEKLVVTGCLSQRHPDELAAEMPEVDHFLGSSDMLRLGPVLAGTAPRMWVGTPADWVISASDPRVLSTRGASAYVKIAEGCSRSCSFCVIPSLRGRQRSRSADDVVREVEALAARGVLEVNLVSQDTVSYGRDRDDGSNLLRLVERVAEVPGLRWLRLFYLYPEKLSDALLDLIAQHPRVLPYVDMPLQHASSDMLRRMRRGVGGGAQRRLVQRMRERIPDLTIRSAFILGHPGETEEDFQELIDFVTWAEFDHVGAFLYSDEESSQSFQQDGKVPRKTARARVSKLMALQRRISRRRNKQRMGQQLEVLVEGPSEESELVLVGRHRGQAPEIDGVVYLSGDCLPGQIREVRVTQTTDYDLLGEVVDEASEPVGAPAAAPLVVVGSDGRRVLRTI